jgi:hypothetical protein
MLALLTAIALGLVALFGFFAALGLFAPKDVLWLSIAAAVLVVATAVHSYLVRRQLGTHGNQEHFRPVNNLRERRGF